MRGNTASLLLFVALASSCSGGSKPSVAPAPKLSVFLTTDLQGTIEPCGCTTDPWGDLARTAELVHDARQGKTTVLHMDGGSTLYTATTLPASMVAQEELKADFIARAYRDVLKTDAVGLGPYDLALGADKVRLPRQAVNVSGVAVEPPKWFDRGGVRIGVFGLVGKDALRGTKIQVYDPKAAAEKAIADLKKQGAQVLFGLYHMTRNEAQELANAVPGVDFIVVGQTAQTTPPTIRHEPVQVRDSWLLEPVDRGQVVLRLDLSPQAPGPWTDAIGKDRAAVEIEELAKEIQALEADLARFKTDKAADPQFITTKERELKEARARKEKYEQTPLAVPDKGNWFTASQIVIRKRLPCLETVKNDKRALDKLIGEKNLELAKGKKAPLPARRTAGFVGSEECETCHSEAAEFWQKTRHAQAWDTLVEDNKQFNLECIGCHITGFDEPGGATLGDNAKLRDVQCEVCHGPGSLHMDASDAEKKRTITLAPTQKRCTACHNEKHSDTFQFEAYLRDVTGAGHGEAFRKKLGDGPTGRELRAAGLKKAGTEIGKGCQ
jgi:hypothetical protein